MLHAFLGSNLYLLPYFHGNADLKHVLQDLLRTSAGNEDRSEILRQMLSDLDNRYPNDQCKSIGDSLIFYDEDNWSTMLFHGLKRFFPEFQGKFYSTSKRVWYKRFNLDFSSIVYPI